MTSEIVIPNKFLEELDRFIGLVDNYKKMKAVEYTEKVWNPVWQKRNTEYDKEVVECVAWVRHYAEKFAEGSLSPVLLKAFSKLLNKNLLILRDDIEIFSQAPSMEPMKDFCDTLLTQTQKISQELEKNL